ncbi:alanine--tRNA ligase [Patescibacteria group bacterium]|nr:alanine--tRNA ligase [Patescibacteria group bacterium]
MITTKELRNKYLDFFKSKNHTIIDGACLIPENDPSILFTTAGMHPLVPYLLGEKHPGGVRLANYQKCIRTGDIEEVGDNSHLTFFEMLGNWSLGEYFKKEAIEMSFEFLTKELGIDKSKLAVTVFAGDDDAPKDEESYEVWKSLGIPEERIAFLGKEDNWWNPAGPTGPCGPDSEMFYWTGKEDAPKVYDPKDDKWLEIWNDVFMQYNKTDKGTYEPLKQKNVDTGMGLERTVAILNGYDNVYEVDTIKPIIEEVTSLVDDKENIKAIRIITDHIRAAVMIIGDDRGASPSNVDQGYVVRRLIRSAIRRSREVGASEDCISKVAKKVIEVNKDIYPEINNNRQRVLSEIKVETEKFSQVLGKGEEMIKEYIKDGKIDANEAFQLYTTYGFPIEEIQRLGVEVDMEGFQKQIKEHQDLSRKGAEQKFKGGLADHSEETTKLHTATHLLHAALRMVLGEHVAQKGSNITADRARFDFSHPEKLTDEQKEEITNIINNIIDSKLPISHTEMSVEEAKNSGALGLFNQKYGDKVKVYTVGSGDKVFSMEICGGPHVENTGDLGTFRIKKEQASSAGIRRIKAVLE